MHGSPKKQKVAAPQPRALKVQCSLCDLPWELHSPELGGEPTTLDCIRLLRAECEKLKARRGGTVR